MQEGGDMQALREEPPSGDGGEKRGGRARRSLLVLALLAGVVGLTAILLSAQGGQPAPSPGASGTPTIPSLESPYDEDGIPRRLAGEPVLRGAAIRARAATGDPGAFLVAGWPTQDPIPSCAPSPVHCGFTSLVDAPGSHESGVITLERPGGTELSFDGGRQWAGGFYVLRARAACTWGASVCLVVDEEEVAPSGALPRAPDGFDPDGLPLTVDGQPVVRGPDVARRLGADWDSLPIWVTGRVSAVQPADRTCQDLATWDPHPCPAAQLADPDHGFPFGPSAPVFQVDSWGLQAAWEPGAAWPGGYVVLRVRGPIVLGYVLPPGASPVPTALPMPTIAFSSSAYRLGIVLEIEGRRVRSGDQIGDHLATEPQAPFLVTGAVRQQPCEACADGAVPVLVAPTAKVAGDGDPAFALLRADGSAFTPGSTMDWTDPVGIVVLEVRPFAGACPPGVSCGGALEVIAVVAPPDV